MDDDSNADVPEASSEIWRRRRFEIESRASGIPPGCLRCARLDPGVSSLALLNPRLMSVTPPGVNRASRGSLGKL
jgi:hypothetical protein